jgi:hypothetical protein
MTLALKKWKNWSLKASCSAKNQACIQSYFMMHQHRSPKMGSVCNICVCRKAEEDFSIADDDWECHSRCPKETQTGPSHRKCAAGRLQCKQLRSCGKEAMLGLLEHDDIFLKHVEMYRMNQHDVSKPAIFIVKTQPLASPQAAANHLSAAENKALPASHHNHIMAQSAQAILPVVQPPPFRKEIQV